MVINERTGTIVTGENVTISAVAVSHGTLTVSISPEKAAGDTTVGETIALNSKVMFVPESVSIGQVAKSLSVLGATPTDMIAIFQAMKRAGAINAKLEIM
ncbi:MAG: Strongly similar to flagellar P-ring protein [uncultured bacterium]|nr:MAG: Strongly similar to flagellar P-ring protein [uncultured bacterium]